MDCVVGLYQIQPWTEYVTPFKVPEVLAEPKQPRNIIKVDIIHSYTLLFLCLLFFFALQTNLKSMRFER